jgi:hypothetical protein
MKIDRKTSARFVFRRSGLIALALAFVFVFSGRAAEERAVKSRVAPVYPEIAKRMRISGVVKLEVTVDALRTQCASGDSRPVRSRQS